MRSSSPARLAASSLIAAVAAAAIALVLDQVFLWASTRTWVRVEPRFAVAYLLTGIGAAALVALTLAVLDRRLGGDRTACVGILSLVSHALALIYLLPFAERLAQAARSLPVALPLALALAIYAAGWLVLRAVSRSPVRASLLLALATAAGLAVNRHLIDSHLSTSALVADLLIMLIVAAGAGAARRDGAGSDGGRPTLAMPAVVTVVLFTGIVLAAPLLLASSLPEVTTSAEEDAPHLILLVIDTLRYDVFQSVLESTPEGRQLSRQLDGAAYFRRTMAAASWTAPSVGSIMTGLYPAEHGFGVTEGLRGDSRPLRQLAPTVPTLASRLRNRGYLTEALIGNPILHRGSGIERGFDRYEVLDGPTNALPLLTVLSRLELIGREHYPQAPRLVDRLRQRLPILASADRPLFLWLHFMDPHEPIFDHPSLPPDESTGDLDTKARRYRDEVRFTARHLARSLELLDAAGLTRNAVIALVADHGEMFQSDGHSNGVRNDQGHLRREGHGHALYEELVHVPLIIRPPDGLPTNRQVDALASHTDLHDTLIELLGVDVPAIGRDRISLAPWLAPSPDAPRERAWTLLGFAQHGPRQRGMRTPSSKLITYDRDLDAEFYDLLRDPTEQNNLAPTEPEKVERTRGRLDRRWATLEERATEAFEIDVETRRQLEALGYL